MLTKESCSPCDIKYRCKIYRKCTNLFITTNYATKQYVHVIFCGLLLEMSDWASGLSFSFTDAMQ